jgi:hypothetical protein
MPNSKSLWRPNAFGTIGAGFLNDNTLRDGIHVRWSVNYQLGLPFESEQGINGGFRIFVLNTEVDSISDADLFTLPLNSFLAVRSDSDQLFNPERGMIADGNILTFWKRTQPDYFGVFWLCQWRLLLMGQWNWSFSSEQRRLLRYAKEVLDLLKPDLIDGNLMRERSEACAVDIRFNPFSGSGTPGNDDPFIHVVGIDRNNRRIVQDWAGITSSGATKRTVRLRAPGIVRVSLEQVPGKPTLTREEVRWILCEDYCQDSSIWQRVQVDGHRFTTIPDFHNPVTTETFHYRPFQRAIDSNMAAEVIQVLFVGQPEVQEMFSLPNVYDMTRYSLKFDQAEPNSDLTTTLTLPLSQNLMAASIDPLMARILGLYFYSDDTALEAHDILVEASLPFFHPDNLAQLDDFLSQLVQGGNATQFFLDNAQTLFDTRLCGLVLAPRITKKELPPQPDNFTTTLTINAVPAQDDLAEAELIVSSKLAVPIDNINEIRPYLVPIGYELERSLSGSSFTNVIADEDTPDELDEIGIIPPLYFPQKGADVWISPLQVLDDFVLPAKQSESVQYRLRAYDLFGRPSQAIEGTTENIPLPCLAPTVPANVSSRIVTSANKLFLELTFSVAAFRPPLQAEWQAVEITVHQLPINQGAVGIQEPPCQVEWAGTQVARNITIPVAGNHSLELNNAVESCLNLTWSASGLQRSSVAENACSEFPDVPLQIDLIDPSAMNLADSGYRTYQLRMAIADLSTLTPDQYRWCTRLRIEGRCMETNAVLHSDESCVTDDWLVTPPPALPVKPIPQEIPVSTYPDLLGDSYFTLDLASFGLNQGDMVNIYQAGVDRVIGMPANFIIDNQLQNVSEFEQAARITKRLYELVTPQPIEFRSDKRFHSIKVPGNLRDYYVLGVIGTNQYLQERDWSNAAVVLFTTPDPAPLPRLNLIDVEPVVKSNQSSVRLTYDVDAATFTDPDNPPRVQVMRRDLTMNQRALRFVGETIGTLEAAEDGSSVYRFIFEDDTALDWNRYIYESYLLVHIAQQGQYLKADTPVTCDVVAPWNGINNPFDNAPELTIGNPISMKQEVKAQFACGEFDFSLVKLLEDDSTVRESGAFRNGQVIGVDLDDITLDIDPAKSEYSLTYNFPNIENGSYTLRLTFGQMTWTKRQMT